MSTPVTQTFTALGDPVRATIVDHLSATDATVGELAALFEISQRSLTRHLGVLERAGLITRRREGRTRRVQLEEQTLDAAHHWLQERRRRLEHRHRRLGAVLARLPEHSDPTVRGKIMNPHDIHHPGLTEHRRVGEQSVVHRREFSAPAALVQRAHTDVELFRQWMGPRGTTVRVERFDAVTGGAFHYIVEAEGGGSWPFHGSYHVVSPGLIVHTWEYEEDHDVTLETLHFVDHGDGSSALEATSTYPSKHACDAMIDSGLDAGMDEDFERLDTVLKEALG
ncbi:MAG: ArsR/SmtB family transcription factor [Arthrobacter sp.]|uniref:ArsR/SmtB family transcription factor n=1 Tax=unclassified Arthrobacter TaxID=235627 RepID=UPI003FB72F66